MRTTKHMVNHIPITEARVNLGALVKRVHLNGEYFILEKDGIPVAGIMDAGELEDYLELQDPRLEKQIAESARDFKAGRFRPVDAVLTELKSVGKKKRGARKTA